MRGPPAQTIRTGQIVALVCSVAVTGLLLWASSIPLGVPGEWVWPRLPANAETLFGAASALVIGLLYVGFILWGRRGINECSCASLIARLTLLVAAAFGWLWLVQESGPSPGNLSKVPFVLYYPGSSGYFWQARYEVQDAAAFLAGYEALLAQRDFLHIGTHPPGLTLAYRGLLALCETSAGFCDIVLATCPNSARDALDTLTEMSAQSGRTVTRADHAAIWLAALLVLLAAAATAAGVYLLVRRDADGATAWTVAGLWPFVPAVAVFHPKSDTLFPFLAVFIAALWLRSCDRHSLARAFFAGFVLWLGMLLSLAFMTIAVLVAATTLWEWAGGRQAHGRPVGEGSGTFGAAKQRILLLVTAAAGFLLPTVCLRVAFDINLLHVWRWNFANHALFYEHNARTWWKWLLVNPLELAFAVGLPICVLAAAANWRLIRRRTRGSPAAATSGAFLVVWGLLWFSGKNMGEAARLWILLMPWVVMSAAPALQASPTAPNMSAALDDRAWRLSPSALILTAQMLVCILTVLRIDGFHFTELVPSLADPAGP